MCLHIRLCLWQLPPAWVLPGRYHPLADQYDSTQKTTIRISKVSCLNKTYFSVMKLFRALWAYWNPTLLTFIPYTSYSAYHDIWVHYCVPFCVCDVQCQLFTHQQSVAFAGMLRNSWRSHLDKCRETRMHWFSWCRHIWWSGDYLPQSRWWLSCCHECCSHSSRKFKL
jgi:hypothetical protein